MTEVYSWATPNGHQVHVMLEECGLPQRAHAVDIGAGSPFKPEFLSISPHHRIPAIVDPDGPVGQPISLLESSAILLQVAGKTGPFLPADVSGSYERRRSPPARPVRRDRRAPGLDALHRGAGGAAQAGSGRRGAREPVWQRAAPAAL